MAKGGVAHIGNALLVLLLALRLVCLDLLLGLRLCLFQPVAFGCNATQTMLIWLHAHPPCVSQALEVIPEPQYVYAARASISRYPGQMYTADCTYG